MRLACDVKLDDEQVVALSDCDSRAQPPSTAGSVFLDNRFTSFYRDWDSVASDVVAILRAEAGRDPYERQQRRERVVEERHRERLPTRGRSGSWN